MEHYTTKELREIYKIRVKKENRSKEFNRLYKEWIRSKFLYITSIIIAIMVVINTIMIVARLFYGVFIEVIVDENMYNLTGILIIDTAIVIFISEFYRDEKKSLGDNKKVEVISDETLKEYSETYKKLAE